MSFVRKSHFVALSDVVRAAERWADARKPTLVTVEDVELMGAVMRWRTMRDRKASLAPPPAESTPRFDPEAETQPGKKTKQSR